MPTGLNTTTAMPTADNADFTSPVTVLPLVVALVTIVAVLVAACFIYHRRQRKRTQELVRQLRVTERRIDAIGTITAKKQQALAARKVEYCPPVTAVCSSNSNIQMDPTSVVKIYSSSSTTQGYSQAPSESNPSTVQDDCHKTKTFTVSVHNTSEEFEDEKLNANDTSYYCSTCRESVSAGVLTQYTAGEDMANSSMAVECATIPAVSSLSTVYSGVASKHKDYRNNRLSRSRSEQHRKGGRFTAKLSRQSINIIRGLRLGIDGLQSSDTQSGSSVQGRSYPTGSGAGKKVSEAKPDILPRRSTESKKEIKHSQNPDSRRLDTNSAAYIGVSNVYAPQQSENESEFAVSMMMGGTPNTPVTSAMGDMSVGLSTDDFTTDSEGVREKWV